MPVLKCLKCGGITNTAVADWMNCDKNDNLKLPEFADRCFLKVQGGGWVEGCSFDDANPYQKHEAQRILDADEDSGTDH